MPAEIQQRVEEAYLEDQLKVSYINYAMSVIVGRALPDVRDGFKPVHRRILYAMYHDLSLHHNKRYSKCAGVVGEVLKRYHPHGDSAVYDTLVRLAQEWVMRYPLVDGQGNFGSIDGDPPAAYRYTECRLEQIADYYLNDIDKETVNFGPNFDDTLQEPLILPTRLPNLLINGSAGIAVGMATNIPPHNMREVIDAVCAQIEAPDIDMKDLMKHVRAPDFPTGGIIYGSEGIQEMYETGRGKITVRAKAVIERLRNGKDAIVITEMPYQVAKTPLIEKISELVREEKLKGISAMRDESDRDGIRLVIELKKGEPPQVVLNNLFKHTQLQITYGAILLCLVHNQPLILNLKRIVQHFIDFRKDVVTRRTQFELRKAEERAHILEGLKIAIAHINEVVNIIKKSKDTDDARKKLTRRFKLTEVQAQAILDMTLKRLTGLEVEKIEDELKQLEETIKELKSILASEKKLMGVITAELQELKKLFGDDRRTEIVKKAEDFSVEDLIAEEDVVVTISHDSYIKRIPVSSYRRQRRGGHGVTGMKTKDEDAVEHLFVASTHNYILFFTDQGKCLWLKVYDVPEGSRASRGKALTNCLAISGDERITAFVPVKEFTEGSFLFMVTRDGTIKRVALPEFSNPRSAGIRAITLDEKDALIGVKMTSGNSEIILSTRNGTAIRFHENDVRVMGRSAGGVRGIRLGKGDAVVSASLANKGADLLTVTEKGYGKRTPLEEYRVQSRGGKGIINMKATDRNGKVIDVLEVSDKDELLLITKKGVVMRIRVKEVRECGRNTQGVRLINLAAGDALSDVARVVQEEAGESEESPEPDKA
ncbi:MAG: DNA gyrase subunit A [Candidatus Lindowbacteria bacterium RIFCSPLOWO2_12_FULL_62_27]|nr:MAG: DNA gyrase subunit A [Candidatus Lindowbacteria bacterium RIFCSPLOWO2_02_FULL_62_12]OGH60215.1 MAG: DNA gyrase subunit A [Candidatus Lindowbacteria bacterium RIFCSPLOWO2_12_FULL_62_27]